MSGKLQLMFSKITRREWRFVEFTKIKPKAVGRQLPGAREAGIWGGDLKLYPASLLCLLNCFQVVFPMSAGNCHDRLLGFGVMFVLLFSLLGGHVKIGPFLRV